jgi:hypothetical protein
MPHFQIIFSTNRGPGNFGLTQAQFMPTSHNSVSFGRCLNESGRVCTMIVISPLFFHLSVVYIGFHWFFLREGALLFSKATPGQGLHEAIKTFDMPIGVKNLTLQPVVMHGIRQSVRFIMFTIAVSPNIFFTEIFRCGRTVS